MSVLWQVGWIVGGLVVCGAPGDRRVRGRLQRELHYDHHAVHDRDCLYWIWFRESDRRPVAVGAAAAEGPARMWAPAFG